MARKIRKTTTNAPSTKTANSSSGRVYGSARDVREPSILDALRTPIGRYAGVLVERAARRPRRPRGAGRGRAQRASIRRTSTRSTWATPTRRARTTATWPGWRRCWPACRSRCRARRSTGCARRGWRRSVQGARADPRSGEADLVLAGGVESMSRAPLVDRSSPSAASRAATSSSSTPRSAGASSTRGWPRAHSTESMGETAENVAERYDGLARRPGRVRARVAPARDRGGRRGPLRRRDRDRRRAPSPRATR